MLLAVVAAPAAPAGTLDGLPDAQIAARFAPRLVLHADERYAPTSADELLALGATLVRRDGSLAQPAPLTAASLPTGSSCVGGLPCAWALRLGCGLVASRPCPAPTDAPRLMYARVVRRHPLTGSPPAWFAQPDPHMPYPGLAIVVQYWFYSLVDDWHSTPRGATLPGGRKVQLPGDPPAPRGRLGGGHGRDVGRSPAVRRLERALRGRVAAVRGRDAGRRSGRRADASRVVGRARIARQSARARDRATPLVALRPPRRRVRAPAGRDADRLRRDHGPRRPPRRRPRHCRSRGQRHAAGAARRARQPAHVADVVPRHLGRARAHRGRPRAARSAGRRRRPRCRSSGATRSRRSSATPRAAAGASAACNPTGMSIPAFPPRGAFPLRPPGPALSRSSTTPTPRVLGLQLRAGAARARGALRRPADRAHGHDRPLRDPPGVRGPRLYERGHLALAAALPPARDADGDGPAPAAVRHRARLPPGQGRRAPGRAAGRGPARCASRGSRPIS